MPKQKLSTVEQYLRKQLGRTWPTEVSQHYEPVRLLGKGAFGEVILAKKKTADSSSSQRSRKRNSNSDGNENDYVAIKQVMAKTVEETLYARRELYILREIPPHPNVIQLLGSWGEGPGFPTMILAYAGDTTLDSLLKAIGAPSLIFSRIVIAQLVDAVAHLHSHAVMHRDISPRNIMISNATAAQYSSIAKEEGPRNAARPKNWPLLRRKWHLTLIDFGFARALGTNDIGVSAVKQEGPQQDKQRLDVSHRLVRNLSALGTHDFSAPEVKSHMRKNTTDIHTKLTDTLSPHVSDYGMTADAYSVGLTARYLLTGVAPDLKEDQVMATKQHNPLHFRAPKKRLRPTAKIPPNVAQWIQSMTRASANQRMSVREARLHPYVSELYPGGASTVDTQTLVHLQCSNSS